MRLTAVRPLVPVEKGSSMVDRLGREETALRRRGQKRKNFFPFVQELGTCFILESADLQLGFAYMDGFPLGDGVGGDKWKGNSNIHGFSIVKFDEFQVEWN
jgi:hypothetical protein